MKRFLSVFLAVIMVMPLFAFSSVASCGVGDVDGDGVLAAADYLDLKTAITVNGTYSGTQLKLADVNGDGLITSVDLLSLGAAVRGEATIPTHTYNNSCDTTCNYCGEVRTIKHTYTNACDASCNVCGATRTPAAHVYTNACDTSCNVCGATRTVTHTYDSELDTSCNVCGQTRAIDFGSIVVGVNARYIGDGYEAKVKQAFEAYLSANNYALTIEYRTLGDTTSTTAAQLGNIIKTAGDIDVVLAAGNNINTTAGVAVKDKRNSHFLILESWCSLQCILSILDCNSCRKLRNDNCTLNLFVKNSYCLSDILVVSIINNIRLRICPVAPYL